VKSEKRIATRKQKWNQWFMENNAAHNQM